MSSFDYALYVRNSQLYLTHFTLELNVVENSDKRWEAQFLLGDKFIGDPNSVRVYKRSSNVIIEKKIPIPPEVQQSTVSTYIKGMDFD